MPCFRPLKGYRASSPNPSTGKYSVVFNARKGMIDKPIDLPCGQCIHCRLEKSRQWAMRCVHEASLHSKNCFITLTYNDENKPQNNSLDLSTFQGFMKRLRKRYGHGIRYFHCGEYGETLGRPHYHALLFNFDFPDKTLWSTNSEFPLYTSESLSELWNLGFSTIGDLTFESAAYCARYVTKKITGDLAKDHYQGRKPEYCTMSRRKGIGYGWIEKYRNDVYPFDEVIIRGKKMKPAKAYDRFLELNFPTEYEEVKQSREIIAKKMPDLQAVPYDPVRSRLGRDRLSVIEQVKNAQFKMLKRGLDNET